MSRLSSPSSWYRTIVPLLLLLALSALAADVQIEGDATKVDITYDGAVTLSKINSIHFVSCTFNGEVRLQDYEHDSTYSQTVVSFDRCTFKKQMSFHVRTAKWANFTIVRSTFSHGGRTENGDFDTSAYRRQDNGDKPCLFTFADNTITSLQSERPGTGVEDTLIAFATLFADTQIYIARNTFTVDRNDILYTYDALQLKYTSLRSNWTVEDNTFDVVLDIAALCTNGINLRAIHVIGAPYTNPLTVSNVLVFQRNTVRVHMKADKTCTGPAAAEGMRVDNVNYIKELIFNSNNFVIDAEKAGAANGIIFDSQFAGTLLQIKDLTLRIKASTSSSGLWLPYACPGDKCDSDSHNLGQMEIFPGHPLNYPEDKVFFAQPLHGMDDADITRLMSQPTNGQGKNYLFSIFDIRNYDVQIVVGNSVGIALQANKIQQTLLDLYNLTVSVRVLQRCNQQGSALIYISNFRERSILRLRDSLLQFDGATSPTAQPCEINAAAEGISRISALQLDQMDLKIGGLLFRGVTAIGSSVGQVRGVIVYDGTPGFFVVHNSTFQLASVPSALRSSATIITYEATAIEVKAKGQNMVTPLQFSSIVMDITTFGNAAGIQLNTYRNVIQINDIQANVTSTNGCKNSYISGIVIDPTSLVFEINKTTIYLSAPRALPDGSGISPEKIHKCEIDYEIARAAGLRIGNAWAENDAPGIFISDLTIHAVAPEARAILFNKLEMAVRGLHRLNLFADAYGEAYGIDCQSSFGRENTQAQLLDSAIVARSHFGVAYAARFGKMPMNFTVSKSLFVANTSGRLDNCGTMAGGSPNTAFSVESGGQPGIFLTDVTLLVSVADPASATQKCFNVGSAHGGIALRLDGTQYNKGIVLQRCWIFVSATGGNTDGIMTPNKLAVQNVGFIIQDTPVLSSTGSVYCNVRATFYAYGGLYNDADKTYPFAYRVQNPFLFPLNEDTVNAFDERFIAQGGSSPVSLRRLLISAEAFHRNEGYAVVRSATEAVFLQPDVHSRNVENARLELTMTGDFLSSNWQNRALIVDTRFAMRCKVVGAAEPINQRDIYILRISDNGNANLLLQLQFSRLVPPALVMCHHFGPALTAYGFYIPRNINSATMKLDHLLLNVTHNNSGATAFSSKLGAGNTPDRALEMRRVVASVTGSKGPAYFWQQTDHTPKMNMQWLEGSEIYVTGDGTTRALDFSSSEQQPCNSLSLEFLDVKIVAVQRLRVCNSVSVAALRVYGMNSFFTVQRSHIEARAEVADGVECKIPGGSVSALVIGTQQGASSDGSTWKKYWFQTDRISTNAQNVIFIKDSTAISAAPDSSTTITVDHQHVSRQQRALLMYDNVTVDISTPGSNSRLMYLGDATASTLVLRKVRFRFLGNNVQDHDECFSMTTNNEDELFIIHSEFPRCSMAKSVFGDMIGKNAQKFAAKCNKRDGVLLTKEQTGLVTDFSSCTDCSASFDCFSPNAESASIEGQECVCKCKPEVLAMANYTVDAECDLNPDPILALSYRPIATTAPPTTEVPPTTTAAPPNTTVVPVTTVAVEVDNTTTAAAFSSSSPATDSPLASVAVTEVPPVSSMSMPSTSTAPPPTFNPTSVPVQTVAPSKRVRTMTPIITLVEDTDVPATSTPPSVAPVVTEKRLEGGNAAGAMSQVVSKEAATGVASGAQGAVVASAAVNPSAANKGANMANIISIAECMYSDDALETSFAEVLLVIPIGNSPNQYLIGGSLVSLLWIILVSGLQLAMAMVIPTYKRTRHVFGIFGSMVMSYFIPTATGFATTVLFHPFGVTDVVFAFVSFALIGVAFGYPLIVSAVRFPGGSEQHVSDIGKLADSKQFAAFLLVDGCRDTRVQYLRLFMFEDMVIAMLLSFIAGIRPNNDYCLFIGIAIIAVAVLHLAYLAIARPFAEKADFAFALAIAIGQVTIAISATATTSNPNIIVFVAYLAIALSALFFVQAIVMGVVAARRYLANRKKAQREAKEAAEGGAVQVSGMAIDDSILNAAPPADGLLSAPLLNGSKSGKSATDNNSASAPKSGADSDAEVLVPSDKPKTNPFAQVASFSQKA